MNDSLIFREKHILQDLIGQHNDIGIILGENHDIDKMSAAVSLYLALFASQKKIQIVSKKEPIVALSNLVGVDKIKKSFDGTVKLLTISVPNENDEIVKISYTTADNRVNLNLFASEDGSLNIHEKDIQFIKKGSSPELLFVVGVASFEEIKDLIDLNNKPKIINIDNNATNTLFGDLVLSDPLFSSLSEIVAQIINFCFLPMDADTAQNLIDGITFATENFSSTKTSPYAFEAAGILLRSGAKRRVEAILSQSAKSGFASSNKHATQDLTRHLLKGAGGFEPFNPSQSNFQQRQNIQVSKKQPPVNPQNFEDEQNDFSSSSSNSDLLYENNSSSGEDVPSDWFMPKVFKGSKKQE